MNDLFINPVNGDFSGKQPMKRITRNEFLYSIEDIYRYGMHKDNAIGAFYPVRCLPSRSIESDSEWPIVLAAGDIVSALPIKDANAYSSGEAATGILTDGDVYVSMGIDEVALKQNINQMYPEYVSGLLVPANGGSAQSISYTDNDGLYGILTASGEVADSEDTYTSPANAPLGIVNHQVWADMRMRYLNYDRKQQGITV